MKAFGWSTLYGGGVGSSGILAIRLYCGNQSALAAPLATSEREGRGRVSSGNCFALISRTPTFGAAGARRAGMTLGSCDHSMTLLRTAPFDLVSVDVIIGAVDNIRIAIVKSGPRLQRSRAERNSLQAGSTPFEVLHEHLVVLTSRDA